MQLSLPHSATALDDAGDGAAADHVHAIAVSLSVQKCIMDYSQLMVQHKKPEGVSLRSIGSVYWGVISPPFCLSPR